MQGVMNDKNAIAFVGYANCTWPIEIKRQKAIQVDGVFPTKETIQSGTYKPLFRPLFTYVNHASIRNKINVANYVEFIIKHVGSLVKRSENTKRKNNEQLRMLTEIKR